MKAVCDENSWLKLSKKYIEEWDISSKIDQARENILSSREILRALEIGFREREGRLTPTDQLKEFVEVLYKNLQNLDDVFNSIDQ